VTSSGLCHQCGKIAYKFHYNKPFSGNGHDGFWHCAEHGPQEEIKTTTELSRGKPMNSGMNRAERRALKIKGKVSA